MHRVVPARLSRRVPYVHDGLTTGESLAQPPETDCLVASMWRSAQLKPLDVQVIGVERCFATVHTLRCGCGPKLRLKDTSYNVLGEELVVDVYLCVLTSDYS